MKITITPDIEQVLVDQARKQGTTPEMLVLDSLRKRFLSPTKVEASAEEGETLADFLRDHIGVLCSSEHVPGGARMSENTGRKFAAGLLRKRRQGRL